MDDAESTRDLGQPVDEPVETTDPRVSTPDDGFVSFDEEDSEEAEASLGDDSFAEDEAEPDEEH